MTAPHPNVDRVRRFYEAMVALDIDTITTLVDPEIEIAQTEVLPWGGRFHGIDGLGQFFLGVQSVIASRVTHTALFAAGDDVVQIGRTAGTVRATGAPFDIDEMHLFTFRDGRIIRFEARIDTPAMLAVLDRP